MTSGAQSGSTKGIAVYLIIAFGIAWVSWAFIPHSSAANPTLLTLYVLPGAFAPALATFIVRKWITREGFGDAGLGLHLRKWRYYLFGWFLPFPVLAFIVVAAIVLGLEHPNFSMTQGIILLAPHAKIPAAVAGFIGYVMPLELILVALVMTPVLFGEEFGWRGYLQLRLFPNSPTRAAVTTGIIWGLWHLPIILRGYEFAGNPAIAAAAFCVTTVLISIIFGWLRERSGSIWVTSLAHSATNVIGGSLTVLWFADRSKSLFVNYGGVLSWIPLGLLCIWIVARRANAKQVEQTP
ncbi:MAG: type II CAAX endopeptidase family protein [Rhizomicrobium sp.]|jgi:membrane protease YdiL (CAAX protease family)